MKKYCNRTCGFCTGSIWVTKPQTTTTVKTTTDGSNGFTWIPCGDVKHPSFCQKWKQLGRCNEAKYKSFMAANCNKTCNICTGPTRVRITTTTEAPTTTTMTTTQNNGYTTVPCEDAKHPSFCRKWKGLGRCSEEEYKTFMETNCKKTCKICTGPTRVKITTSLAKTTTIAPTTTPAVATKKNWL